MLVPRTVTFSSQVYSIETIKKAAYRFSDVLSVDIIPRSAEIECVLHFVSDPLEEGQTQRIVAAFKNEVLDQDLRSVIARETEATRNAVLAFALSKTGLQGSE
jgi:His-Xaa-Ser system protein HxsD